jgi:adenine-specific DNA-methyltransferase
MILQNLDCEQFYNIDLIEAERVVEQIQLDASKNSLERNRLGQFATPNSLAIEILKYAKTLLLAGKEIHFLDPAIGTGSFYSALLQLFPLEQIKSAVGYEIDQAYAEVALKLWARTSLQLHIADFTESDPPQNEALRANLLICNPPYVRHHHLSKEKKIALKKLGIKTTGIELSGLAGLYCYFLLAAHSWMAQNCLACWIIPSEFMDVNYGKKLKKYLLEQVTLLRVHRFDPNDLQFGDVLVSTSVIWFRNTKPDCNYLVDFTYGGTINHPTCSSNISSKTLTELSKWNYTSVLFPQKTTIQAETKLSDLFEIKRGVATGANDFFILMPEQINDLHIPFDFLTPILPSPRYLLNDEILSDEQGNPRLKRKLFLLTCKQPMDWLQAKYPSVWNYLQQGESIGVSDRYLCKHRSLWYLQETRDPAIILCPYMGRHESRNNKPFRFILNHSKAVAPNVYLMMYPKAQFKNLLSNNPELIRPIWNALNSIPIQSLIHEGRVYGDGLHKLEPRELANAPADLLLKALENHSHRT